MLPYPSYLRVYEPAEAFAQSTLGDAALGLAGLSGPELTLDSEQRTVITRVVASESLTIEPERLGAYVLRRNGQELFCPGDVSLRSWLSLTSLVESIGGTAVNLLYNADTLATAGEEFLRWRRDHPQALPHIRQTTWGIPRTWFVMVAASERELYRIGDRSSVRYCTTLVQARRRIAAAHAVLAAVIDDDELLDGLLELDSWLDAFDDASWLELDYAGLGSLLGAALATDESARDIHAAIDALRRRDFAMAGTAYRAFEQRWRVVRAYERAN